MFSMRKYFHAVKRFYFATLRNLFWNSTLLFREMLIAVFNKGEGCTKKRRGKVYMRIATSAFWLFGCCEIINCSDNHDLGKDRAPIAVLTLYFRAPPTAAFFAVIGFEMSSIIPWHWGEGCAEISFVLSKVRSRLVPRWEQSFLRWHRCWIWCHTWNS